MWGHQVDPGETITLFLRTNLTANTNPTQSKVPVLCFEMGAGQAGGEGVCRGDARAPVPAPLGAVAQTPCSHKSSVHFTEKWLETFQQQMYPSPKGEEKKEILLTLTVWMVNNVERRKCREEINKLRLYLEARM